jgi:heat shock protein HslJ
MQPERPGIGGARPARPENGPARSGIWEALRRFQGAARRLARLRGAPAVLPLPFARTIPAFSRTEETSLRSSALAPPILAAILAAACSPAFAEDKKPAQPIPPWQVQFPFDQTFSLRELNGKPVDSSLDISLKIDSSMHGSGYTGCNSWSAVIYPVNGQKLLFGPPALTKKTCAKDGEKLQNDFLAGLTGQPSWDLVNGELIIKGPHGTMKLVHSL